MSLINTKNRILSNLLVEDYAAEGKCISRVDGKVIFIDGVVPGDIVDVRLLKSKKDKSSMTYRMD